MLEKRHLQYNESLEKLKELEMQGKAFVISPQEDLAIGRLVKDSDKTAKIFNLAYQQGQHTLPSLKKWLNEKI
ncbi:hypothetical protein K4L44_06055 [Halosquirtibacter laminarini]|uniref:Uncharacterized protein n=2 Tax=Halosquirtibacter laminarini TaxID=3374600 RepID=A0AC61NPV2_9BACT|nr:hypothetical protein K4L44_06055 [Prolixibacteraceae bacterium]